MRLSSSFSLATWSAWLTAATALAVPTPEYGRAEARALNSNVLVSTPKRGTFRGIKMDSIGQDQFLGVRYVRPITSANRFQRASYLGDDIAAVIHDAISVGPACIQPPTSSLPASAMSEDCLTMQIIRPQGISSSSPVPVLVFFHGGGWSRGVSSNDIYNGTKLVAASVQQKQPIIYINLNYRLGIFGFLGGSEMQSGDAKGTAALNAGYWDQRMALQFISSNIASFGGDPDQITIWGQSAGAASVAAHLLAQNGQSAPGFISKGIMESGSAQLFPRFNASARVPQAQYNTLLKATSCVSLDCLRRASLQSLSDANTNVIARDTMTFSPTLDNYFHTQPASKALSSGALADIPILMGTNVDDGTFMGSCKSQNSPADTQTYFEALYRDSTAVTNLLQVYPDQPSQGAPFRPVLYGASPDDRFYGSTSQWKRCTAIETDLLFTAGKRSTLDAAAKYNRNKAYGYLWAQRTPTGGTAAKGVTHSCELGLIFNRPSLYGQADAAARTYASSKDIQQTTNHIVASLLTFVRTGNPNANGFSTWPAYDRTQRQLMQFQGTYNTTVIADTFRDTQVSFIQSQATVFGI
ncbi:unnamed protein product [Tilletia controversa]|uniref:Carboxylic ester hydrolase n=3 Tax=Tilletia TaxID=13289 RepID=A0A8X7MSU2_9BASI|nr:hypothetical protein CF336_g3974 [Tilletia laevis]KAE8198308.1 hypothetical protein CF328_g3594 [Tilletia controversa]KAE8261432.1 hypothetical protein A4X03_0g3258 [Tilletia caries]KAE8203193.1 hypothetical protein CF335_g3127 [Tilletia laevis]KAE8247556.1 hypothetical protein A4X06_0g4364 [Tilletia controversa]